jgi:hypothetical protein
MKKRNISFLTFLVVLCLFLLFLPLGRNQGHLSDFSMDFFRVLFQSEWAKEVFGLDGDEAEWVFSDQSEPLPL